MKRTKYFASDYGTVGPADPGSLRHRASAVSYSTPSTQHPFCYDGTCTSATTATCFIPILTWLFENELGLRSGRQDMDGSILPGFNHLHYHPITQTLLSPHQHPIPSHIQNELPKHMLLLDTKIPRSKSLDVRRGLNLRQLGYLTRAPRVMTSR
jgi:hypothetical protein